MFLMELKAGFHKDFISYLKNQECASKLAGESVINYTLNYLSDKKPQTNNKRSFIVNASYLNVIYYLCDFTA